MDDWKTRLPRLLLGGGSLFFGAWGLFAPDSLARVMGSERDTARMIGARDTAIGSLILYTGGPEGYAARAVGDVIDVALTAKQKPRIAAFAGASALVAAGLAWWSQKARNG